MIKTRVSFTFEDAKKLLGLFVRRTNRLVRSSSSESPASFGRQWQRIDEAAWDFCMAVQFLNQNSGGCDSRRFERLIEILSRFVFTATVLLEFVSENESDFPTGTRELVDGVVGRVQGVVNRCGHRIERHRRLIDKSVFLHKAVSSMMLPAGV
jgi:hypothetical protein